MSDEKVKALNRMGRLYAEALKVAGCKVSPLNINDINFLMGNILMELERIGMLQSKSAYDQLMQDARNLCESLQAIVSCPEHTGNAYEAFKFSIRTARQAKTDFDKKYPQANEKE